MSTSIHVVMNSASAAPPLTHRDRRATSLEVSGGRLRHADSVHCDATSIDSGAAGPSSLDIEVSARSFLHRRRPELGHEPGHHEADDAPEHDLAHSPQTFLDA